MRSDQQVCLDTHAIIVVNTEGYKPMEVILSNCVYPHRTHTHSHTLTHTQTHSNTHAHTHAQTYTHTPRTHTHTHTHTHRGGVERAELDRAHCSSKNRQGEHRR